MSQDFDRVAPPVTAAEREGSFGYILSPEATHGLGQLGTAAAEAASRPEERSMLDLYRFSPENTERTRRIVGEADMDPNVQAANDMLYKLAKKDDDYAKFVRGVFVHQRDVAELAVAGALEAGIVDEAILRDVARAGLSHDGAKGKVDDNNPEENLAEIFMYRGKWSETMRRRTEKHPMIEAAVQSKVGLSELVQYLTERHHKDLKADPERHIEAGGYGGETIIPPAGQEGLWAKLAHIFSVADYVAANTRVREEYKSGMMPVQVVAGISKDLVTPEELIGIYSRAAGMPAAA